MKTEYSFCAGNKVKIIKKVSMIGTSRMSWVEGMDKTIGKSGIIKEINYDRRHAFIEIIGKNWYYDLNSIELVIGDWKE